VEQMDALKAEIERKRKQREEAAASGTASASGGKRWVKRGDIEKARVAKYYADEERESKEREARLVVPCLRYAKTASGTSDSLVAELDPTTLDVGRSAEEDASVSMLPVEVKRLLRQLNQPIQLFGESDEERLERYRAVSAAIPSVNEEHLELKQGQMFNETQLYDEAGRAKQEGVQLENEVDEDIPQNDEELEASFTPTTPEQLVSRQFKTLIKLWEHEINARSEAQVRSVEGKKETGAYLQCRRHMKPFFRQLKHREMPLDVLTTMIEITQFIQQREYVRAHDAYIRCAIGNAPWPMGISGTGVHERQGRQHIRENKVAHVMNDETQRKYLQSVKRLLTFAQRVLPATGPSKMVT